MVLFFLRVALVCVNKIIIPPATTKHPQSAKHVEEAQAAKYPRIVTVDRPSTLARRTLVNTFPAMKTCRADNKKINTGDPKTDYDCDEYPQAVFRENAGKPSVKSIRANDNRGSGNKIGYYLKAHANENQVEVVVPVLKGKLYCKDAF
ncbi:hypothetical protein CRENPOLYSF2_2590018 [Crenothrix polyspora]|uniref:Uncharacterized protein n=1 Tax=Crenothrix polyspora TaxID=360316 RepID=A0A1R4H8A4_9GAMM|nr:NucA/NucB deoxyribonuclease domain-containing protein [Crenothrix polyspora]SJM92261.1 hypothetical protein CRENPOLYSF2_2590018 [Crenothrix polyspora]